MDDDRNLAQSQQTRQATEHDVRRALSGAGQRLALGMNRMVQITFAGNGFVVIEHLQGAYDTAPYGKPVMVFSTPTALIAYLTEQVVGGPGGPVEPVEPEQAGLDLGGHFVRDEGRDFQLDERALTNLDKPGTGLGPNIHGIGPDEPGGPNPDYVPPTVVCGACRHDPCLCPMPE